MMEGSKFQNSAAEGQSLLTPISALNRKQTMQHQSLGPGTELKSPSYSIKFPIISDLSNEKFERQETEPPVDDNDLSAVSSPNKTYSSVTNLSGLDND